MVQATPLYMCTHYLCPVANITLLDNQWSRHVRGWGGGGGRQAP